MTVYQLPAAIGLTRDEGHNYTAWYPPEPPKPLRSVTTILDRVAKPFLIPWAAKIAAGWAVDNVELILRMLTELDHDATVSAVASRGKAERDRKAGIGTDAHKAIEHYLLGLSPVLTEDTAPLFEQFLRFQREWRFQPIWSEAMVCSERFGYAGTFDLYGILHGKRCLIDTKTGNYIAPEMGMQLAAYGNADYIGRPGTTDRWKVPPVDLYLILHLQPDGYELLPFDVTPSAMQGFLAAQEIDRWLRGEGLRSAVIGQPLTEGMLRIA